MKKDDVKCLMCNGCLLWVRILRVLNCHGNLNLLKNNVSSKISLLKPFICVLTDFSSIIDQHTHNIIDSIHILIISASACQAT